MGLLKQMSNSKRQKRVVGDFLRIDLGDDHHSYARVLDEAMFAFYDARVRQQMPLDQVVALPVLLLVPVMKRAVTGGRWVVFGNAFLDDSLLNPP